MDDVSLVYNENANLRKIQNNLLKWEAFEDPLAPITKEQEILLSKLANENDILIEENDQELIDSKNQCCDEKKINFIQTNKQFSDLYSEISADLIRKSDKKYEEYYKQLSERNNDCLKILEQIEESSKEFTKLQNEYEFVSNKTSSLHLQSENIIQEQKKLHEIGENIQKQLFYYTQIEKISQRLSSPTLSVSSEIFLEILNTIDNCLEFMRSHSNQKDASSYQVKYKQCLSKATILITTYVNQILISATEQIFSSQSQAAQAPGDNEISSEAIFALYYGKFQGSAPKIKKITSIIEERLTRNQEYEQLHSELINHYFTQRANIMSSAVENALKNLTNSHNGDHCALMRSSCAFLVHVCQDEHRLFYQFFTIFNAQLTNYLEGLCIILYDILRPFIIHINHLETLAEICSILKNEMLEEHVNSNPDSLEAFGKILYQLLNDVQERLVFRTHIYLQKDIASYKPSPGDLAYPEQLEMMEKIALSLRKPQLVRTDSRLSTVSHNSSIESEAHPNIEYEPKIGNSPADLHGMWYPTVRRTLVCLSRLYRCVDRTIFQGLSQEALSFCIQSVSSAAHEISIKKTLIDGELFEIKHLLILREQIAPFRVDFTVKETSLDFSKVKTAAFSLLVKRKQLFVLGSNNAILEFLLDGTPLVKEHLLDSKKDVDRQLKHVCETFIKDATYLLIASVLNFIEKTKVPIALPNTLRLSNWASPQIIGGIVQEGQRNIKKKLPEIQRAMQLYLANKDTEFILLRPIRNNIIEAFVKLGQILLTNNYTKDDMTIVNCPTADQISFIVSSVNILEN